jgi:DNA-binding transcriptional LysR family regulator
MNLKALQSLLAIHDAQSFQEAARRLGVTQSAVSMQIKTLENDLGVELFDRSVRPPSMTNAAVAIIKPAREIIALAQSIRESLHDQSTLAGHLSLGAVSTSTLSFLPDGLIAVRRRYPGITIKVETGLSGVLLDHVKSGSLDAAIITEPKEIPPGLRCEVLVRESLALVCSIESNKEPLALNDVMKMPFIRFNRRAGVGQIIEAFLAKKGLHPDESMERDRGHGRTRAGYIDRTDRGRRKVSPAGGNYRAYRHRRGTPRFLRFPGPKSKGRAFRAPAVGITRKRPAVLS